MGVRFPTVASTTIIASVPASGAETVVVTTPPLNIPLDFAQIIILWCVEVLIGTGTTVELQRLHRGTTTAGAQVNVAGSYTVGGGNRWTFTGCYVDTPGAVAGQQYSLSLSGTGTTGAWTTEDVSLIAFAL